MKGTPVPVYGMSIDDDDQRLTEDEPFHQAQHHNEENSGQIVRQIASFLTLSDCASLAPVASFSSLLTTPETPGLIALSPLGGDDLRDGEDYNDDDNGTVGDDDDDEIQFRLKERRRKYVTQKLAAAVFAHPQSLRSFCVKAHQAASVINEKTKDLVPPETLIEPDDTPKITILDFLIKSVLQNIPLSVALHVLEVMGEVTLDTSFASFTLTIDSVNGFIEKLVQFLGQTWEQIWSKCSSGEIVSGIQSVATGVGSAALQRLSRGDLSSAAELRIEDQKLLQKLSQLNAAGQVISYMEREDEALTRHAKKRVQRMMHYEVSLKPFVATVVAPEANDEASSSSSQDDSSEPFLCTPQSFPPTPASRNMVMARGTRFAEDVVFLARDKLRLEGGLDSSNEQTRAMAQALREASRLAVFNAADIGNGIMLMCGQHVAQKVGNVLYCSTRSMVPVLRNSFAYFEMTVVPRQSIGMYPMATVSVGLSTLEMPMNTLVGAWKGSVGLCTTGQMLAAGQWCSPLTLNAYAEGDTVGCLVCLDDGTAFETWDGVMVTASVTFNVNGNVVSPPITMGGSSENLVMPLSSTLPLLVPMEEELFPTVTLHSPATQVMCRFSSEDILATSRDTIGAPAGVPVYTVDGSVLFDEGENEKV